MAPRTLLQQKAKEYGLTKAAKSVDQRSLLHQQPRHGEGDVFVLIGNTQIPFGQDDPLSDLFFICPAVIVQRGMLLLLSALDLQRNYLTVDGNQKVHLIFFRTVNTVR